MVEVRFPNIHLLWAVTQRQMTEMTLQDYNVGNV